MVLRTIREESRALRALEIASDRWAGAEVAWEAILWGLAHDPEIGALVPESASIRSFIYVGARSIDHPDIIVLYEVLPDRIVIHDAIFEEAKAASSGTV